jgi:uncharacterized protein YjbI with pentapeptide repeats
MNNEQQLLDFENARKITLIDYIKTAMEDDSSIENMIFENEELDEADFSSIEFEKVKFINCSFKKCNFSRSRFYHTEFINCNLSLSDFSKTFWKKVMISESNVVGGRFLESLMKETKIIKSILDYANFYHAVIDNCIIENCKCIESSFAETKLKKLTLKEIIFTGTDFFKTSLRGIDLSHCIIDGIKISADLFELKGATLSAEQAIELIRVFDIEVV